MHDQGVFTTALRQVLPEQSCFSNGEIIKEMVLSHLVNWLQKQVLCPGCQAPKLVFLFCSGVGWLVGWFSLHTILPIMTKIL